MNDLFQVKWNKKNGDSPSAISLCVFGPDASLWITSRFRRCLASVARSSLHCGGGDGISVIRIMTKWRNSSTRLIDVGESFDGLYDHGRDRVSDEDDCISAG